MDIIIAEKPIAAQRIASILGTAKQSGKHKVPVYELKDAVVIPLIGHILEIDFPEEYSHWTGTALKLLVDSDLNYTSSHPAIEKVLKEYGKKASRCIIATDYDREGESIGKEALDIIKSVNPKIEIKRVKFSALMPAEVKSAFKNLVNFDDNLADSADSRREIDLIWGAVLTRFISIAAKRLGKSFLSVGRVQTPTLALAVDREKEIRAFKSEDFWVVSIDCIKNKDKFTAIYKEDKIFDKKKADKLSLLKSDTATVKTVDNKKVILQPPTPFNTTDFLRSASNIGVQPGMAMSIAEKLYTSGYISYPRTDNTVYPEAINLREVLQVFSESKEFGALAKKLLKQKSIKPTEGKKKTTDHPPIYPVSVATKSMLKGHDWSVYELVVRRFFATLSLPAELDTVKAELDYCNETFIARGKIVKVEGWKEFYPYSKTVEEILPELNVDEKVKVEKLNTEKKQTQPKPRYSPAALIKLLDELNLGTKCLDGKTKIKFLENHNEYLISLKDLFKKYRQKQGVGSCISVDKTDIFYPKFSIVTRRKLDRDEQIYELTFSDGTKVKATSNHLFYTYSSEDYKYIPAADLKVSDKIICINPSNKIDSVLITWKNFIDSCNKNTNIYSPVGDVLRCIRQEKKLSQYQFSKKFGFSQGNLTCYEKGKRNVPLWILKKFDIYPEILIGVNKNLKIKNPFPLHLSSSLVRIIANFCGDGSIDFEKLTRENCIDFRYSNTNLDLLKRFSDDINFVFGFRPEIKADKREILNHSKKYYIRVPSLIGRILLPCLLHPKKYIKKEFYPEFIGAFFDDEGHAYKNERKIFISNTNNTYLLLLHKMLKSIGINSSIDSNQYKLYIRKERGIAKFLESIPIASIGKKQRIINMLSFKFTPQAKRSTVSIPFKEKQVLNLLAVKDYTSSELANQLNLKKGAINTYLRNLIRNSLVKQIVLSKNHIKDRNVIYKLSKSYTNSFYSLLEEKVLGSNVTTLSVLSVKPIKFNDYVYDITVNPLMPNFALSNGIIVHNSTRAEIIQKLIDRGYLVGQKTFTPSQVAFAVIDALEEFAPDITKPDMTSKLEKEMDLIEAGKKKKLEVVDDSREMLHQVLQQMALSNVKIENKLRIALNDENIIGKCPNCSGSLKIITTPRNTRFIGCTGYSAGCRTSFPLPAKGIIQKLDKQCPECSMPVLKIIYSKRKVFEMCINHNCKSKEGWKKKQEEVSAKKK